MNTIKILLIEDDKEDMEIVQDLLRSSSLQVELTVADSSKLGIEKLENGDFHCVLIDHMIPGMSGMNVIMEQQQSGYTRPFIVLTGYGDEDQKKEMIARGAFDYLCKRDLNLKTLEEKIHKALIWNYKKDSVQTN